MYVIISVMFHIGLRYLYPYLRSTQQKIHINNCVEGKILECLFDTAHKTPSAQEVDTLKLQLSTYNSFFTGEIQEDACECLMLLIELMNKGFGPCPTNDNINSKGSFSELLFSFVLYKYTGSTLYSEGSFVRRFFSPKPFEVAMLRRTYGPKVLYSEVPLLRKLLCSEDSIFRKASHYMDSMLRRLFSPKFI